MKTAATKRVDPDVVGLYLRDISRHRLLNREDETRLGRHIKRGAEANRLLNDHAGLTPERAAELRRAVRRGEDAKRTFVQCNLRLVVSIAKKYRSPEVPFADIIQEGTFGLIRAVEKFDHTMGFRFSTYAVCWIRHAIQHGIMPTTGVIRIPLPAKREVVKVRNASTELAQRLGCQPTVGEIADEVDLTTAKVTRLLTVPNNVLSLDIRSTESGADLHELVADHTFNAPDDTAIAAITKVDVHRLLESLKERERQILKLRFGLDGSEPLSCAQVAEQFSLSSERIRQIEASALKTLRTLADRDGASDLLTVSSIYN